MQRSSPNARAPWLVIAAAVLSGSCSALPESISCQSLRELQIGMSESETRALVGRPQGISNLSECGVMAVATHGECWFFESDSPAKVTVVQLVLMEQKLAEARAYYSRLLGQQSHVVFELSAERRFESPDFEEHIACR